MINDRALIVGAARWAEAAHHTSSGLSLEQATAGARAFLTFLKSGEAAPTNFPLDGPALDVLHATGRLLADEEDPVAGAEGATLLLAFLEGARWPEVLEDERAELEAACAFAGWRASRRTGDHQGTQRWLDRWGTAARKAPSGQMYASAEGSLEALAADLDPASMEDPRMLLTVCGGLRNRVTALPSAMVHDAAFLYGFLESSKREIGLFDERDYFLGEVAMLAGAGCRYLSRREEAWVWFARSEEAFARTRNAAAELSRLAYQRMAEMFEERHVDEVVALLPPLYDAFRRMGMFQDALKCRFLEGLAYLERGEAAVAIKAFQEICEEARSLGSEKLLAHAYVNLVHAHGMLGESAAAIEASRRAIPLLQGLDDRIALGKVHWGLGILLRAGGHVSRAIESCREAQTEFEAIGMRADVAALQSRRRGPPVGIAAARRGVARDRHGASGHRGAQDGKRGPGCPLPSARVRPAPGDQRARAPRAPAAFSEAEEVARGAASLPSSAA